MISSGQSTLPLNKMFCLWDVVIKVQLSFQPFWVDARLCRGAGGKQLHPEEHLVWEHPCALLPAASIRAVLPNHIVDSHCTMKKTMKTWEAASSLLHWAKFCRTFKTLPSPTFGNKLQVIPPGGADCHSALQPLQSDCCGSIPYPTCQKQFGVYVCT